MLTCKHALRCRTKSSGCCTHRQSRSRASVEILQMGRILQPDRLRCIVQWRCGALLTRLLTSSFHAATTPCLSCVPFCWRAQHQFLRFSSHVTSGRAPSFRQLLPPGASLVRRRFVFVLKNRDLSGEIVKRVSPRHTAVVLPL